ncbi:sulfatase [Virgibacillus profundi]|uniref:Sulfatase n=2 Tax=Virgibacillus profundi TaxID=2024555 RepID=A0A2A2IHH9_9BACI|nr:sulfatase [Virgibacillus profundi]PXY54949.1 sulfatase [Virgibacillus profundi]
MVEQMNVMLIMTDQQRWDALGCYGNDVIETPNLDYLASRGTVFENAYTPSPSCVPARASLLTGMDPWSTGILGMGSAQGPMGIGFDNTLPGELAEAGYHTQGIGKMHFYPQQALNGYHNTVLDESGREYDPGFKSDYKQWFEKNKSGDYGITDHGIGWNSWMARPYHAPEFLHPSNWTINESIDFLEQRRDPSKPFFLKTSFARPHSPYDAPEFYFNLYLNDPEIPKAEIGEWAHIHDVEVDAKAPDAWRGVRSKKEIHRARAGYYGSIHHIDQQIGRLINYLQLNGLFDNTMIVFLSDHGDMLGDHNLWRKTYAYEGSAHIPLLIKMPDAFGTVKGFVEEPVLIQDIMPTILEAMSLDVPESVDGTSLLPLIRGEDAAWREYLHGEHSTCYAEEQEMQYLTDGKFKYIWFPRTGMEQLFHLTEDPYENKELSGEEAYQDTLLKWRTRMVEVLEKRDAGLTEKGQLICQKDKPFLTSPHYNERLEKVTLYRNKK